ncbi:MAG: hypothetical protein NTW25_13580 [Candidatus Kapabacteria bacterium]|nr:hypothetical protein [Candidatus Kapabacteria bacterium]
MKKTIIFCFLFSIITCNLKSYVPDDFGLRVPYVYNTLFPCSYNADFRLNNVNHHKRGILWSLYSMKLSLAWEITKGSQKIFMGARDIFAKY